MTLILAMLRKVCPREASSRDWVQHCQGSSEVERHQEGGKPPPAPKRMTAGTLSGRKDISQSAFGLSFKMTLAMVLINDLLNLQNIYQLST